MRSCSHIKSDGRPCNAPALRKHSYCFFHQQQVIRRRREYPDRLPILEDRAAVQVAIMQVLDRLYLKTIDYKAAALMLYGLQLASTNLKHDVFGRLDSEKVDRYYGNANETEAPVTSMGAPSKPAVGLGGSVAVPEARDEVPHKLDPERAAELERLFNTIIPEIKACADDLSATCDHRPATIMDAPPLSRSDRVGNGNLDCCHSERSEESLSSPNNLSGAPGSRRRCANLGEKNSSHHGLEMLGKGTASAVPRNRDPKVASLLPQALLVRANISRALHFGVNSLEWKPEINFIASSTNCPTTRSNAPKAPSTIVSILRNITSTSSKLNAECWSAHNNDYAKCRRNTVMASSPALAAALA